MKLSEQCLALMLKQYTQNFLQVKPEYHSGRVRWHRGKLKSRVKVQLS